MKLSECRVGLEVKSMLSSKKGEIGFITGFGQNGIDEVIPVVKWESSGIESEIHWSNIELADDLAKLEKPPIGLMPKKIHDEKRAAEIVLAMNRFLEGNMAIPREWVAELLEFYDR